MFASVSAASSANAQFSESALAEAHAALERGDAELAIDILEEALESSDDPQLHHHLYLAYGDAGDAMRAARHLEAYLDSDAAIPEEERATLAEQLDRMLSPGHSDDATLTVLGWSFLAVGIAGVITFAASASATLVLTEQAPIDTAWIVAGVGLGTGLVLGTVGAVLLFLAGQDEGGATRSLPPDLDPSLQRPFSLIPWADPRGAGATLRIRF